ncbi:MAG TPA: phosphoglycerate mutase family protein [Acidimicrobiia bacterium]|nr:phosphoglycerate mutase family protein [Acidimicrobiia bacterium]
MTVLLVRHAQAGRRDAWKRDDRLRPLSSKGHHQAKALAVELADYVADAGPRLQVLASPFTRCRESVLPLAAALNVAVSDREELAEGGGRDGIRLMAEVAGGSAVVCTHGDVVGDVLAWLAGRGIDLGPSPQWPKASTWVLETRKGIYRAAHYLPPPR